MSNIATRFIRRGAKEHKCFGCHGIIPKGAMSVLLTNRTESGIQDFRLCIKCSVMASAKTVNTGVVRDGEFENEDKIPNCLKKAWKEKLKELDMKGKQK